MRGFLFSLLSGMGSDIPENGMLKNTCFAQNSATLETTVDI
jgi:hypothetical protein